MHADIRELGDQAVDQAAPQAAADPGMRCFTDDDVLHRELLCDADHGVGDIAVALDEPALQQLGELPRLDPAALRLFIVPPEHDEHGAEAAEASRETARTADERTAAQAAADGHEHDCGAGRTAPRARPTVCATSRSAISRSAARFPGRKKLASAVSILSGA